MLGMLIPPSAMLIIYAIVAEQSVGEMFIAGFIPGIVLAVAYVLGILAMAHLAPRFIGGSGDRPAGEAAPELGAWETVRLLAPVAFLVVVVLGGIYSGWFSPEEAGAAGSAGALAIGVLKRRLTWRGLWRVLVETGHITAAILFLIIAASMYSRMLGVAALPTLFSEWLTGMGPGAERHDGDLCRADGAARHDHRDRVDHPDRGAVVPELGRGVGRQHRLVRHRHP